MKSQPLPRRTEAPHTPALHMKTYITAALASFILPCAMAQQMEVAFSLQGSSVTWFAVDDPGTQGSLSFTGLPGNFDGNGLAYDPGGHRLLFVNGPSSATHALWSLDLTGVTLASGSSVDVGAATSLGNLTFGGGPVELYGGAFYNGSYYTLINGGDTLRKVDFTGIGGDINDWMNINLPGNNTMFLGDLAFDSNGDLWISGNNDEGTPTPSMSRLWHYSTTDGVTFTNEGSINHPGLRFNGILFDTDDNLYGYRVGTSAYGTIEEGTGTFAEIYSGAPFNAGGDLTNGFLMTVVVPEPSGALLIGLTWMLGLLRRRRK